MRFRHLVVAVTAILAGCSSNDVSSVAPPSVIGTVDDTPDSQPPPGPTWPTAATIPVADRASSEPEVEEIRIAVIGDSLTVSATEEISAQLSDAGLGPVQINAVAGRRIVKGSAIPSGLTALQTDDALTDADIWVVALGTNDVGSEARSDELSRDVDLLLDQIGPERPVIWLDVFIASRPEASADFGAQLHRLAGERDGLVHADWYHTAQQPGVLAGDGVHLTPEGQQRFAAAVVDAVQALVPTET